MNAAKLSRTEFVVLRDLVYEKCGIFFADNKRYFLESKLMPRLQAHSLSSYGEYYRLITTTLNGKGELEKLIGLITTHETSFFREMPQFQILKSELFPKCIAQKQAGIQRLRIWSAACSSGEEPHTIAMLIDEHIILSQPSWQIEIVGTDLSETILARAKMGHYTQYALRNTPPAHRLKYFTFINGTYHIKQRIRHRVKFSQLNLFDPVKMQLMRGFDFIFCRNALIYFDLNSKTKVVESLYKSLIPGGYLFLGTTESLFGIQNEFKIAQFSGSVLYQKPL